MVVVTVFFVFWQFRYAPMEDGAVWDRWRHEKCLQRFDRLECISDRRERQQKEAEQQRLAAERLRLRWSRVDTIPRSVNTLRPGDPGYDPNRAFLNIQVSDPPLGRDCRGTRLSTGPVWLCAAGP